MDMGRLRLDARRSATFHGHRLGVWQTFDAEGGRAWADCINKGCTSGVAVDTNPPPNGIDIMGSAVAVGCPHAGDK